MPLTARQAETAKAADKDYKLTDGQGLYLLVKTTGAKYWNLKYRFGGKERKLSIGVWPVVTLAQARVKREEARRMIAEGKDPSYEKQAQKRAHKQNTGNTFKFISTEWFDHKAREWTPRYHEDQFNRIRRYVWPVIGHRPVTEVKPLDMLECLRQIESEGKLEALRKTRQVCVQIFAYAVVTGRATVNPADYLSTVLQSPRRIHHRNLTPEHLPDFLCDLLRSEELMALATRLLMLTALRTSEMRLGCWEEVDFDKASWEIPKERMKMRRPHLVPLSRQTLEVLKQIKTMTAHRNSPYIFPGARNAKKPRDRKCINDFLGRLGWHQHATGHGFRHTFSTIAHDAGFNSEWVELQIAHADENAVRGIYNHARYLDGRREMMQWYADYLDGLIADRLT